MALKFIPPGQAADESARRRLLHEAYAAARLDHPFVCKVYEVAEAGDRPFIAMEYVEGETLRDRLLGGPIPIKDAIRIAAAIAEALDSAHKRGIVHRDLKPSNVSHVTAGEIYERLGRADEARRKYEALVKIWKDGDPDLVALKDARARLAIKGTAAAHGRSPHVSHAPATRVTSPAPPVRIQESTAAAPSRR